ncbi:efflux RND transporter permease subunit [Polycyclovorans algicola]|uniref:efflux RND transporter permease subunit n=1 Tax=Polycyclovorans algicola TaxID=616992 RepID=UPI0004A760B8|nr:efflux RND transporter permease subunit [Polycyclovorans algicola]
MHFTDIFIKRPVLATVISLAILLLGIRAGLDLKVREYPELQTAQVTVTVAYPGADAALMEGFITTPLEREIATADGIDYLGSSTGLSTSVINAYLRLDKDPNEALTEISAKVNKLRSQLPPGAEDPVVEVAESQGTAAMYLSFYSEVLSPSQITDYLTRIVEPQLSTIAGVEKADILGARTYAMRVWLKPERLSAHNLTAADVYERIRSQNVLSAVGEMKGNFVRIGLSAQTDLRTAEQFKELIVQSDEGSVVRLSDVADVELGAENYDGITTWGGVPAIFIAINPRPEANVLDTIAEVRALWPGVVEQMPDGLDGAISYDSTEYIRDAISEVQITLAEAMVIVLVVIFLFLGSVRSALIPAVTVPLSLVGVLFFMLLMGYTLNLLTLLAMVLAIGMVVDDAIIVLENIHRHIEEGMKPFDAAIQGARELLGPVIAMTITLVAVFAPIGFLGGITGTLFSEFAFTLAGAVVISGVIALTLTPMMCAKILKPSHGPEGEPNRLADWLDQRFESWRSAYKRRLHSAMNTPMVITVFAVIVIGSCYFLFRATPSELAPNEDFGFAFSIVETDGYASQEYFNKYFADAQQRILDDPDVDNSFGFSIGDAGGTSQGFIGMMMKPWTTREVSTAEVLERLTPNLEEVTGMRWVGVEPAALPTPGQGYPVEFILKSTESVETIAQISDEIIQRANESSRFFYLASRLKVDRPEGVVEIDRDKAALLGVDMSQLSADLSALLAGGEAARFSYESRSYRVIPQVDRQARLNPKQLEGYYTRARNGDLVPISTLVKVTERIVPRAIEHFQQLNSNTIIAVPRPDVTQGEALKLLEDITAEVAPASFQIDYSGASRQFKTEGAALVATFAFAIVIIYLVLAAQFESFRDPLIMLITVPMAVCGALLVINILSITNGMQLSSFPGATLNIYTQVGLVTLIGVISKHGILVVEFANKLQLQGISKRAAIEEAASIRMRPILMTTAALVVAMVPLLLASGPGAAARFSIGLVIAAGMTIGTLLTLYVVPVMYLLVAADEGGTRELVAEPAAAH